MWTVGERTWEGGIEKSDGNPKERWEKCKAKEQRDWDSPCSWNFLPVGAIPLGIRPLI